MNKISYFKLASIAIIILSAILLIYLSNILDNVSAQRGGRPSFHSEPSFRSDFRSTTPESSLSPLIKEPNPFKDEGITHTIESANTLRPEVSHDARKEKIEEIYRILDRNTESLNTNLKNKLWGDAYSFGDIVVRSFMDKLIVKFLLLSVIFT